MVLAALGVKLKVSGRQNYPVAFTLHMNKIYPFGGIPLDARNELLPKCSRNAG
jgi:hypothetical protein